MQDTNPIIHTPPLEIPVIPGINTERIDERISIKHTKRGNGNGQYFALDIFQNSGTNPDLSYRDVSPSAGNVGDVYVHYPAINVLGNGNMNAYITKLSTLGNNPFQLKKGQIVTVESYHYGNNSNWRLHGTFGHRLLFGATLGLSKTNPRVGFVVTSDGEMKLQYANNEKMIASIFITIN